ncbi:transmembrane amino acid transporter protein [Rhizophagus diaphanus]|nr:transmembrane amino acid transporter protein [Rhizophagus diaphanus] [Rhizophagus sp. MUCL 43196]
MIPESNLSNRRDPWKNYGSTILATSDSNVVDDDLDLDLQEESHRDKGSNLSAYFNIICIVAGSGTLGIPYAIQQGGWITILFLILSSMMNVYANIKLIECLYHDGKSRRISMSQVAYDAFGNVGLVLVGFFFNALSVGCSILYLILSGENFKILFSEIFDISLETKTWIFICASLMCIPFVMLKTMKEASWLSIFGTISTMMVVFVVFITSIVELPNNRDKHEHQFINFRNIPIALATVFFSYGGNIVYPHIESSMKHPSAWPKVLSFATATVTVFYLLVCIPAYATYGDATLSPIYKSLPSGLAVLITVIMITIHILLALPIYQTAFALEIEEYLSINITTLGKNREFLYRALTRILTVLFTVCIAITFPYFADVMSLLGALGNGALLIIMPLSAWIKLFGWNRLNGWKEKTWVVFIFVFSSFGAIVGTIDSIRALYLNITKE